MKLSKFQTCCPKPSRSALQKAFLFLYAACVPISLSAQEFFLSSEEFFNDIPEAKVESPLYPFAITSDYINVTGAHFRTPGVKDDKLFYNQIDAAFAYTHPCNSYCGLIFGASYVGSKVDWAQNPDFHEKFFNYVGFSLGTYTRSFPDWTWTLIGNMFIDTEVLSLKDYALYQAVLRGEYSLTNWLTLDFGFILEIGLDKEKIWPILGFVIAPCPDVWELTVIYPVDISFDYYLTDCWTLAGSVRFLRNRHRVKENEPLPKGIFEYRTTGAEFDLIFQPFPWIAFSGFAGSTFDGDLKITNSTDHDATHFKFKGSFYAGVSGLLTF